MKTINQHSVKSEDKRFLKQRPIQKRILQITLTGIILVCLFIGFISSYIFRNYLKQALFATTENGLSNLAYSINHTLDNVYRLSKYCQGSSDISKYIEASPEPGSVLSVATFDRLYEEYQRNEASTYIPRVVVFTDNHFLQACTTSYSTTADLAVLIPELPFFEELLTDDTYNYSVGIIEDPFLAPRNKFVVPIVRPITYQFNSDRIGYLYMEFSTALFLDYFNHYYMEEGSLLYLTMGEHVYRYASGALIETTYPTEGTNMLISVPLNMKDCSLIQLVPSSKLKNQTRPFTFMLIAVLLSVILIGVVMTLSLNHYIHKPVTMLRKKIYRTAAGDFSRNPDIEWPHELGEIGHGINDLSESINSLLEERLLAEKQKRDLEYKMLQNQINPHFIYNTLNSIKMMASIQGASGIAEMTTALAGLLRSISKGTSLLVPISEELELIKYYFTIQNYRYGGMIGFSIDIKDPAIVNNKILKFTLQPLVENAIFHGLEPKGGVGNINITLSFTSGEQEGTDNTAAKNEVNEKVRRDICIEVQDDGIGIPKEKINSIFSDKASQTTEFFKEIGIRNVHNRLRYEFGENYGISIESKEGEYTIMRVLVPESRLSEVENV